MAIVYVTGPVHIYVSRPAGTFANSATGAPSALTVPTQIYYLGTGEQAPTINITTLEEPVMNDIGGSMAPIDTLYQGKVADISCVLTRWNEYVFTLLDQSVQNGLGRGTDDIDDIATANILEGNTFYTWLHFPYYSKPGFADQYMPTGYRFISSRLVQATVNGGTRAKRRLFAIKCDRVYIPSSGRFTLFDNTMTYATNTAIPAIPPVAVTGLVS